VLTSIVLCHKLIFTNRFRSLLRISSVCCTRAPEKGKNCTNCTNRIT